MRLLNELVDKRPLPMFTRKIVAKVNVAVCWAVAATPLIYICESPDLYPTAIFKIVLAVYVALLCTLVDADCVALILSNFTFPLLVIYISILSTALPVFMDKIIPTDGKVLKSTSA